MVQVCPDRGNVDAARWIGYQYLLGITGVPCDEQMGQRYPTQVVDAGHQAAGVSDGFYLSEHPSCSRARRDAGGWKTLRAGSCQVHTYLHGRGVAGDSKAASTWFEIGVAAGAQ